MILFQSAVAFMALKDFSKLIDGTLLKLNPLAGKDLAQTFKQEKIYD